MKAIVIGSTGLTGNSLIDQLLTNEQIDSVISLVRKPTGRNHRKLKEQVIDFDRIESLKLDADLAFSCLGTTIKIAKTKETFYKVDYQYNLDFAKACIASNIKHFVILSSLGADSKSTVFYSKTKGALEDSLKQLPFETLNILQPSLLVGNRKENRIAEKLAKNVMWCLNPLFLGSLKKYRSIKIEVVAKAMILQSLQLKKGIMVLESDQIQEIGNQ